MKNNRSNKTKSNMSILKESYCITLKNAGQRTHGWGNKSVENVFRGERRVDR